MTGEVCRESNVETRGHLRGYLLTASFSASCGDNPDYAMWDMSNVQAKKSPVAST